MKIHILIAILLVSGTQFKLIECGKKLDIDGLKDMLKPMSKSCKTKTGVTDELVSGTARGQWPRERSLMCYIKCLAVMLKVMNKQGEVTLKEANKQLNILVIEELVPRMKEILENCLQTAPKSDDACESAFNLVVCGYTADPSNKLDLKRLKDMLKPMSKFCKTKTGVSDVTPSDDPYKESS